MAFFRADRLIRTITLQDTKEWRTWLAKHGNERTAGKDKSLAENTVRRRPGRAKQLFAAALKDKLTDSNPFDDKSLPCASGANEDRMVTVAAEDIEKCIENAPNINWRIIIALARYSGLRIPSELERLKWDDVNWAESCITIRATKTEHHKADGVRKVKKKSGTESGTARRRTKLQRTTANRPNTAD